MRVLKSGNRRSGKWVGECSACGAILEAETGDFRVINPGDYRTDYEEFSWMACPECYQNTCFHRIESNTGKRTLKELE